MILFLNCKTKYKADKSVKIYACNRATNISIIEIKNTRTSDKLDPTRFLKIKISPIKLYNTIWPARIFAYNLIIKEKGLINTPKSSIGARRGLSHTGTPGIQKICFQYVLFAVRLVIKK